MGNDTNTTTVVAAKTREMAKNECAKALKAAIGKLNVCLALEDDHLMQHALITLRSECEWCINEFCK